MEASVAIDVSERGDVALVTCAGPLTVPDGKAEFLQLLEAQLAGGRSRFVLDMREVPFMDSPTIGAMMACFKQTIERGGGVKLALGESGKVRQILELTGLSEIVEYTTVMGSTEDRTFKVLRKNRKIYIYNTTRWKRTAIWCWQENS